MVCLDYHKTLQSIIDHFENISNEEVIRNLSEIRNDMDFDDMEKRLDDYFENVSQEQLEKDVRDAGYERYKKMEDIKIFSN